jgi:hypothetical protein
MEYTKGGLLGFDDYNCVAKVYEQQSDIVSKICDKFKALISAMPSKKGIGGDKVDDKNSDKDKVQEKKDWAGIRPVDNNIYYIDYDESLGKAWAQAGAGALAAGVIVVTAGAALGAFVPSVGIAAVTTGSAAQAASYAALTAGFSASVAGGAAGAVAAATTPVIIGTGAVAGAAIGGTWSRDLLGITVYNGFISREGIESIVIGLVDTIDGFVSSKDLGAIMSTLCLLKGAFTTNSGETKAVSAWSLVKRKYVDKEGEELEDDIKSITTKLNMRDVKGFPDFGSTDLADGSSVSPEIAISTIKVAMEKLDGNEKSLKQNLEKITPEEIKTLMENISVEKKASKKDKE